MTKQQLQDLKEKAEKVYDPHRNLGAFVCVDPGQLLDLIERFEGMQEALEIYQEVKNLLQDLIDDFEYNRSRLFDIRELVKRTELKNEME